MNYHNITKDDMLNGAGLRVVLWVAGCNHHCIGCQNPITHDPKGGIAFDDEAKNELFNELCKDYVSGITFSGGDPLYPDNRDTIGKLIEEIAVKFPTKTIWVYTGYTFDEITSIPFLDKIDVICDGKFDLALRDVRIHWVGSANQRIIDVKETLKQGHIVLYSDAKI